MSLEHSPARQKRSTALSRVCLSVDEFSAVTGISRATIYRRMKAGTLRFTKNGKLTRIPTSELARLGFTEGLPESE